MNKHAQDSQPNNSSERKKQLRQELKARVKELSAIDRERASSQACALLQVQAIWRTAKSIFFYSPMPNELNIWALVPEALKSGKIVLLPKFDPSSNTYIASQVEDIERDLAPGRFGINEPVGNGPAFSLNQLDLVLVPGVGFDLLGGRLGRGAGHYDRMLAQVSGQRCGVAFEEQIAECIPLETHDVRMNCILTPTRWIDIQTSACK